MKNEDIKIFRKMIVDDDFYDDLESYNRFMAIYPFTNENIDGYMGKLDLTNKKILTTGSSSDHVINAILRESKNIDVVDLNPFTRYYYELKKAALLELSYIDFFKYFMKDSVDPKKNYNKDLFSLEYYKKLRDYLSNESLEFWDAAYKYNHLDIRRNCFHFEEYLIHKYKRTNGYLKNEDEYYKTKELIDKAIVNFHITDINELKLNKKFDYIFLSNISEYIINKYAENDPYYHLNLFIENISNFLTDDGLFYFAYLWETSLENNYKEKFKSIYDVDAIKEYCKDIDMKEFEAANLGYKDSVLIYKKNIATRI